MRFSFLSVFILFTGILRAQPFVLLDTKREHSSPIESIALTPDEKMLITADHDGYLIFWDVATMSVVQKIKAHNSVINTILFNKKGSWFVTSGEDGKVRLWSYPARKLINSYSAPYDVISFAVISPDGSSVYFGGHNSGSLYDFFGGTSDNVYTGLYRARLDGSGRVELVYNDDEYSLLGSSTNITDGNLDYSSRYVVYTQGTYVYFWDVVNDRLARRVTCPYHVNNLTSTSNALYVWGDGYIMKLLRSDDRYIVAKTVHAGSHDAMSGYSKLVFSKNGKMMVTGDDGNRVNIWNPVTMQKTQVLTGHSDVVRTFQFCKNDSVLVTGGYDGLLKIWGYPVKEKEEEKPQAVIPDVKDTLVASGSVKDVPQQTVVKKDTVIPPPPPKDVVFTENNIPVSVKDRRVEKQGTFYVKSEEFEIEIWDNSVYDHDVISLNINGDWILENYEVTKEKKILKIRVKPNTNNYLILYAINLGEISPNTAAVGLLIDGKVQRLTISSDLQKCGALNFEYRP